MRFGVQRRYTNWLRVYFPLAVSVFLLWNFDGCSLNNDDFRLS